MTATFVRRAYRVPAFRGTRVEVDGRPGMIVSFPGAKIGVRFDGELTTTICHPTTQVNYQPEPSAAKQKVKTRR